MGRTMVVLASSPHHATHWISSLLLRVQLLGFLNIMFALYVFSQFFCMALKRPMAEWSINVIIIVILPLLSLLLLLFLLLLLLLPYD